MPKNTMNMADYLLPLNINGLQGRMLKVPKSKPGQREILYIYGHHASLERNFGVAEYLSTFGGVTIPDLPGFGGMDPFYKIGKKPSLDNMADYLSAFIKLRYKKQKFTIMGYSMGFMIVTRMLQKYPELNKQVELVISLAGIVHKDDFRYKKTTYYGFLFLTWLFSKRVPAAFLKYFVFRAPLIKLGYAVFEPLVVKKENTKIREADKEEKKNRIDFEVHLWQCNDIRTYMDAAHTMFTLNLVGEHVNSAVHHISIEGDRYFNNLMVEQHMRAIFKDYTAIPLTLKSHSHSVISTADEVAPFVPPAIRNLLRAKK